MPNFKKKRNIVHIVYWICAVLTSCVSAKDLFVRVNTDWSHYNDIYDNQFCDAVVFGFLIVTSAMFGAICLNEDMPEKTLLMIDVGGTILYWAAGGLFVDAYNLARSGYVGLGGYGYYGGHHGYDGYDGWGSRYHHDDNSTSMSYRFLVNGIICLLLGFVYLFEFIVFFVKKDLLE